MGDSESEPVVLTVREARDRLCQLLRDYRENPDFADPVQIGQRRRPEAVLMSAEKFLELAKWAERGLYFSWYFEPGAEEMRARRD